MKMTKDEFVARFVEVERQANQKKLKIRKEVDEYILGRRYPNWQKRITKE